MLTRLLLFAALFGSVPCIWAQENDPESLEDLVNQARDQYLNGYPDLAMPLLNEAVSRYPEETEGYFWRASLLQEQEEFTRALSDYQVVIELDTLDRQGWFGYGRMLYELDRPAESVEAFTRLLSFPRGETNEIMFRKEAGAAGVSGMFTFQGLQSDVYYHRGMAQWELDQREEAISDLEKAVKEAPQMADYHYQLGAMYEAEGSASDAAKAYFHCLEQQDYHVGALQGMLALQEEVPAVDRYFAELNQGESSSPIALIYEGLSLYNQGAYGPAVAKYSEAIELMPGFPVFHLNRGMAYAKLKNWSAAESDFLNAIRNSPDYAKAYSQLGTVYYRQQKWDQALGQYNNSLRLNPYQAGTYYNRALVHYNLRHKEEACQDLQKAMELGQAASDRVKHSLCGY
ncbi:MAG: tetratricopeptide repeat protein [Bacteroidota bacterium]